MESSKSNRWHGGSCCEASLTWRPSGPCWPPLSTCAPGGGPGAPAPSSSYHTGQISIPLPDPNCAGNHPSPIHPHLQLSRQESFSKSHRLKPSAPTYYPLHHFGDRLNCELFAGRSPSRQWNSGVQVVLDCLPEPIRPHFCQEEPDGLLVELLGGRSVRCEPDHIVPASLTGPAALACSRLRMPAFRWQKGQVPTADSGSWKGARRFLFRTALLWISDV